jgi:serine/threonine protein kinase
VGTLAANAQDPGGPLAAGRRLGRYEVLAKLASGGMAVVYVARAHGVAGFERLVAIKVLHANLAHEEEFISMFLDEARLAARIRHPNVVPTIDISDSVQSGYYLVMDYIEGDHLGQLLAGAHKAQERLPVPVVLRIVADALGGLGAAHELKDESGKILNLVHRDVSPHNIMVGMDGVSRLTDFGVAKAEDRLTHTRDGQVKGKLAYMAPEQASAGTADARSDLFSMGIILWECLTGRRLFRADSTAATLNKLLHEVVPKPSSIHPELEALDPVVLKALSRDPALRFQTAEEFAEALEGLATTVGGIGSLRSVTKAVKRYARVKLERDRKLISDAIESVRRVDSGEHLVEQEAMSEPSSLSAADISVSSSSLSMSKMSGVFSHATSPGTGRARRNTLGNGGAVPPPPPPTAATPPPFVPPEGTGSHTFQGEAQGQGQRRFLMVAVVVLVGIMGWILISDRSESVRVIAIDSPAPPPAAAPAAPIPAPVVPATPVAVAPAEAVPTAAKPPEGAPSKSADTKLEPGIATAAGDSAAAGSKTEAGKAAVRKPSGTRRPPGSKGANGGAASVTTPSPATAPAASEPKPPPKPAEEDFFPTNPYRK